MSICTSMNDDPRCEATENQPLVFIYDLREVHLLQGIASGIFVFQNKDFVAV